LQFTVVSGARRLIDARTRRVAQTRYQPVHIKEFGKFRISPRMTDSFTDMDNL
jgi:hypothetical protein